MSDAPPDVRSSTSESLAAYMPLDRRRAVGDGVELPDRTGGAALYVDISGFTTFTNQAVERWGPRRAAEEVSALVNNLCDHVVGNVHRYGGSVIGFTGDGITSWFEGDRGRRATAAALAIDAEAAALAKEGSAVGMPQVTMVITAGLARRFVVGNPGIQSIDILAGGIVDRLAVAERIARPGEVLVGGEVIGWLKADATVVSWRHDHEREAIDPVSGGENFAAVRGDPAKLAQPEPVVDVTLSDEEAREWLLPPLFPRHQEARGLENEIRPACSLFLSFRGIDYDFDNHAAGKLDAFIRWVQTVFARHGAYVLQVIVGDKGSYLYGAFGAPLAHEDDALRALRAGEQLLRPPDELSYVTQLKVGIDMGPVLAGTYGGHNRRTYGVLGQTVNNAARLMEAAQPGQMLVTREVVEAAAADVDAHETDALAGRTVFLVERVRPLRGIERFGSEPAGALIGRSDEQSLLDDLLRRLLKGESAAVLITGLLGMGTSRLLADLRDRAESTGVSVLFGAGDPIEHETLFFAFRPILEDLIGLEYGADADAVVEALDAHFAANHRDLYPLLNPLLPSLLPDTELTSSMPAEARRDQTYELLLEAFADGSETIPERVVILDDAQWLDPASLTLLDALSSRVRGLLIAVGARTDPVDIESDEPPVATVERLVRKAGGDVLELGPLARRDIEAVAAITLGAESVSPIVSDVIASRAGGNPYFAQELARALVAQGLVRVENGRSEATADAEILGEALPEQLEAGLVARLDALSPDQQTVLRSGAVLGSTFAPKLLAAATSPYLDREAVTRAIDELMETGLIAPIAEGPGTGGYRFESALVRTAAAGLVTTDQRTRIHRSAAEYLEGEGGSERVQYFPVLAYHWQGADVPDRAAAYWAKAGDAARASSFDGNAVTFYRRAVELAKVPKASIESKDRGDWELRLGESYVQHQGSDSAEGRRWLEAGLRRLGFRLPHRAASAVLSLVPQLLLQLWWRVRRPRTNPPRNRELLLEASRGFERLVEVYFLGGETARALHASLRTLNLAESAGPSPELARETATFGVLLGIVPMRRLAERYLQRALATVDATDDRSAMAWVPMVAAFYYAGQGDWPTAHELATRARGVADDSGDLRRYEDALSNLMMQAYLRGQIDTGVRRADELATSAEERGADLSRAYALQGLIYCYTESGRFDEARATIAQLEQIIATAPQQLDKGLVVDTRALQSLIHVRTGELEAAKILADETMTHAKRETPANFSGFATFMAPAEVYVTIGRTNGITPELEKSCKRAIRVMKRFTSRWPIGLARRKMWTGIFADVRGHTRRARRHLEAAVETAARLGMPLEEATARVHLARTMGGTAEAEAQLARAAELLDELHLDRSRFAWTT